MIDEELQSHSGKMEGLTLQLISYHIYVFFSPTITSNNVISSLSQKINF